MPSIESSGRKQKAVYWALSSRDRYGDVTVSAAVEVSVRWEDREVDVLNAQGEKIKAEAVVTVGQDMAIGGLLWLGELADIATPPVDLKQIVSFDKIPDVKGREFRRVAYVARYSDTLPELAS